MGIGVEEGVQEGGARVADYYECFGWGGGVEVRGGRAVVGEEVGEEVLGGGEDEGEGG